MLDLHYICIGEAVQMAELYINWHIIAGDVHDNYINAVILDNIYYVN